MSELHEFGGCEYIMTATSDVEIRTWIYKLTTCPGHRHNFCVAMDGRRLYTSKLGTECLTRV